MCTAFKCLDTGTRAQALRGAALAAATSVFSDFDPELPGDRYLPSALMGVPCPPHSPVREALSRVDEKAGTPGEGVSHLVPSPRLRPQATSVPCLLPRPSGQCHHCAAWSISV